jgi:hypothetical protein
MSRFSDAAFTWMRSQRRSVATSADLWQGLEVDRPDLATKTETRKTPRATLMRDLRKDPRFVVGGGKIALRESVQS